MEIFSSPKRHVAGAPSLWFLSWPKKFTSAFPSGHCSRSCKSSTFAWAISTSKCHWARVSVSDSNLDIMMHNLFLFVKEPGQQFNWCAWHWQAASVYTSKFLYWLLCTGLRLCDMFLLFYSLFRKHLTSWTCAMASLVACSVVVSMDDLLFFILDIRGPHFSHT